jgi:tetratricopeptide (TPR) repeat protein
VLTENDGPYVEIMVGAFSDNQPDYSWIKPYEVKTWKQYWYPIKDIKGFKYANLNGAVNLEQKVANYVFLGYYSTQKVSKAKIVLKNKDKVVFEKSMEISPAVTFTGTIKIDGQYKLTDLYTELVNSETNEVLVSYQPVEQKPAGNLPEEVKKPEAPDKIATVEELFLTGNRILQFYNPTLNAMDYFNEALKRDPYDIRTNTVMGKIHLKNGEYDLARISLSKAIKRLTKDYTRPENCEPLYLEGLTLKALGLYDEAVDTLYRATWDYEWHAAAYLELARISCIRGDLHRALNEINESLSTNARNNSAIALKAGILRKLGDTDGAMTIISALAKSDPLDFRIGNEMYLIAVKAGKESESEALLKEFNRKMRDFDQNYLELAVGYMNDGMPEEAENILKRFSGKDQEISYYLGYLNDIKGNKSEAEKYFKDGSSQSVDYGFPFRLESENVLLKASEYMPADAKPHYYMGNLLYDKQPERAIKCWERAVELDPSLAIAWRNIGFGYYQHYNDVKKAIAAYEKAVANKNDDPVYYAELDPLYEMNNTPIETRAKLFDGKNETAKKRDDSFVRQIIVLNLSGQYEKAVEYLSGATFHFREGSSRVRDISVDAKILYGSKLMAEKKYQEALNQFLSAVDKQTSGLMGDRRNPQINYFLGVAYEALGRKKEAKTAFTTSVQEEAEGTDFISYYKGLSYQKLGNKEKAAASFNSMIAEGEKRISKGADVDFFAKFGERESANVQLSNAYLLKGLGYKGLGDTKQATENLKKAVELSASNLYAGVELRK